MKITLPIALLYLAGQVAVVTPALCVTAQNSTARPSGTKSEHPAREQLSHLSTELLHEVDLARQAISNKNTQLAQQHVNKALTAQTRIATLAKSKNLPMMIPLYSEFDTSSTLGPLEAARKSGQKSPANNSSQPQHSRFAPLTVDDTSVQYTYVGIDLNRAKEHLEAAQTALRDKNLQSADDSLSALQNDVVMQTVQSDLPLLTARENVGIAEDAAKNNHYTEAAAALKEAASDLKRFADGNPPQHAEDARSLSSAITSFAEKLPQDHAGAATKLDGWWHQIDNWFNQPSSSS
ncbi:MAG TPA: YfdX family protein [Bryobacteraceae bacterium]|jgi:hypothetical protein|nr:YfdX family protein [Bryobacteraceae bacterium]